MQIIYKNGVRQLIKREEYFDKLLAFRDKRLIKVVTGVRRCGKSTLLEMFQSHLLDSGVEAEQIISINFEDMDFAEITNAKNLHLYVSQRLIENKKNYVFLDEVQNIEGFERAVNSLFIKKNVDIYITGSNAYLLSGEIATLLSGRYVEIEMLPLSFKEYISAVGDTEIMRKYTDYAQNGAFPYIVELDGDWGKISDYLNGIYSTVVLKDVVSRRKISDVMMLESVIRFAADNIGNLFSTKKISDTMTSEGRKISVHTVESYISALLSSFIIHRAKRFDIKGRQYLMTNDKYYLCDMGLRSCVLGRRTADVGRVLENIVYLELVRRGYEVYVGKIGNLEVDFVALKDGVTAYYQVAATVRDSGTLARELKPLSAINDNYPKFLLTLDEDPPANFAGIERLNVIDFLLNKPHV